MGEIMPAVSILVPVYNAEKYVRQCLRALCEQTLEDIEIIAINDGSTDSSLEVLNGFAARDERIRVIDKTNSGYGASMNLGLDEARGEFIGIVEPDDYPDLVMFQKLYKMAEKHGCDLVKCNYYEHYEDHEDIQRTFAGFPYRTPFDPVDRPDIICTVPSIWAALYRKSMLDAIGIRFRETPGASYQDTAFTLKAWIAARRVALVRRPLLHYRMDNPNSSVKSPEKVDAVLDELAEAEAFMHARPERAAAFSGWFQVGKYGKYRWNYERIDPSLRLGFAERMYDEFIAVRNAGELDMRLFGRNSGPQLEYLLVHGPTAFASRYSDRLPGDWESA
ncbi:MAG: glycosyltransferase family 2 protein [Eggerthellaceae bacterium]|nr:glycosyltransferase family 2 protein [Eggerthellaceae bacterium]